jgi:hypothetical protein
VYVQASADDFDGDGIANSLDSCQYIPNSGNDTDQDDVDDACDTNITKLEADDTNTNTATGQTTAGGLVLGIAISTPTTATVVTNTQSQVSLDRGVVFGHNSAQISNIHTNDTESSESVSGQPAKQPATVAAKAARTPLILVGTLGLIVVLAVVIRMKNN